MRRRAIIAVLSIAVGGLSALALVAAQPAGAVTTLPQIGSPGSHHVAPPFQTLSLNAAHPLAAHATATFDATGVFPKFEFGAVELSVIAHDSTGSGWLTVYPHGSARPAVMDVYFHKGVSAENQVITAVGNDGKVSIYNGAAEPIELIVNATGYFDPGTPELPGTVAALTPVRAVNTATGLGAPKATLAPKASLTLHLAGSHGIPSSASVVYGTVAALSASGSGSLSSHAGSVPAGLPAVQFSKGVWASNLVAMVNGPGGTTVIKNDSTSPVTVVVDLVGYVLGGSPADAGTFRSSAPKTPLATASGVGEIHPGAIPAHGSIGVNPLPASPVQMTGGTVTFNWNVVVIGGATAGGVAFRVGDGPGVPIQQVTFGAHQVVETLVTVQYQLNSDTSIVSPGLQGIVVYNTSGSPIQVTAYQTTYYAPNYSFDGSPFVSTLPGTIHFSSADTFPDAVARRATGTTAPTSPTDGTAVDVLTADGSGFQVTDLNVTAGQTYSYAVFGSDGFLTYGPPFTITVTAAS